MVVIQSFLEHTGLIAVLVLYLCFNSILAPYVITEVTMETQEIHK